MSIVIIVPPEAPDYRKLSENKTIIASLSRDFVLFTLPRGWTVFCYLQTQLMYGRISLKNLLATADLAIFILNANTWRELMSPVGNSIKDAIDAKDLAKLAHLHRVAVYTGFIPLCGTWVFNQAYALSIPYLHRDNSQTWIVPTTTLPSTMALMLLTSEYIYGCNRTPKAAMLLFALSGLLLWGSYFGIQYLSTTMFALLVTQFIQCFSFAAAYLGYLKYQYPNETLFTDLFRKQDWKTSWKEAFHINRLGIQPAAILLAEVISGLAVNQLLNERSLAAYQPLSSAIMGLGNAISQTMMQRVQFHRRQIKNLLKENPALIRIASRRLLLHSAWLSLVLPLSFSAVALRFSDAFVDFLFNTTPDKIDIVTEAKENLVFVCILLTLRFLAAGPSGVIFAERNSPDKYHQWLNKYSSITRVCSPFLLLGLGAFFDRVLELGSKSYWLGAIIALFLVNTINLVFAWKMTNYDFETSLKPQAEPTPVASEVILLDERTATPQRLQFFQPAPAPAIELKPMDDTQELVEPLMESESVRNNEGVGFFARSVNSMRRARQSFDLILGR